MKAYLLAAAMILAFSRSMEQPCSPCQWVVPCFLTFPECGPAFPTAFLPAGCLLSLPEFFPGPLLSTHSARLLSKPLRAIGVVILLVIIALFLWIRAAAAMTAALHDPDNIRYVDEENDADQDEKTQEE